MIERIIVKRIIRRIIVKRIIKRKIVKRIKRIVAKWRLVIVAKIDKMRR